MKLIIQIPCYNEEKTLGITLAELPREVPGFDKVEWLIIDDGSSDKTAAVAKECGVDHIIRHASNLGLARAFMSGLDAAIRAGADIIVNTDADNQYDARDIPVLAKPILEGRAEMVLGVRPILATRHFSLTKKLLQKLGSFVVRVASGTDVEDAPSGFRAFSRDAAMRLNVFNEHTYTLETIIQAGHKNIPIVSVPVRTNPDLRPSRLVRSIPQYIFRSCAVIVRIAIAYRPFRFFLTLGSIPLLAGVLLGLRFLAHYLMGEGEGMIQSLILAALLIGSGLLLWIAALVADLISINRKLLEKLDWRIRQVEEQFNQKDLRP